MTAGMARTCAVDGCERRAHTDLPWCVGDLRRLPPEMRTAYIRAVGRRDRLVNGAMVELETARAAAEAWFAEHPAEPAADGGR